MGGLDWADLLTAFGLYLVLEGIGPFVNPRFVRRVLAELLTQPNSAWRVGGLVAMASGVALIWLVRH